MWTTRFWKRTAELAVRGAAQFALAAGIADAASLWELSPVVVAGAAALGALLSLLTSVIAAIPGDSSSPLATDRGQPENGVLPQRGV